jgi:hypothetical protein
MKTPEPGSVSRSNLGLFIVAKFPTACCCDVAAVADRRSRSVGICPST